MNWLKKGREEIKLIQLFFEDNLIEEELAHNSEENIEFLIEKWHEAKTSNDNFKELFKDGLRIEKYIDIQTSLPALRNEEGERDRYKEFELQAKEFFRTLYLDMRLAKNLASFSFGEKMCALFLSDANNFLNYNFSKFELEFGLDKELQLETGVNKGIKKIIKKLGLMDKYKKNYDDLLTKKSMLKQKSHIKGKLVLSIDPMDFLTASDNACNWTSCFSILGLEKASLLAMMQSKTACVAYIEAEAPYAWGTNKEWRAWVHIDDEAIFVNKGYPYKSTNLNHEIYSWISQLLGCAIVSSNEVNMELNGVTAFAFNDSASSDEYFIKENRVDDAFNMVTPNRKRAHIMELDAQPFGLDRHKLKDGMFFISSDL